jgi:hypothetical protein
MAKRVEWDMVDWSSNEKTTRKGRLNIRDKTIKSRWTEHQPSDTKLENED